MQEPAWRRSDYSANIMTTGKNFPMFGHDCPRCGQHRTTFDIRAVTKTENVEGLDAYEAFLLCRKCSSPSIGLLKARNYTSEDPMALAGKFVNWLFELKKWVFEIPNRRSVPAHVPPNIENIFNEAASCTAIQAWDAAGTMFRKTLDVATRSITPHPDSDQEPRPASSKTYKDLRLRLDWLFANDFLSPALKDLSSCIHEDGNDAAHADAGIEEAEALDMADFCEQVLEALYTLPGQIEENRRRRNRRRGIDEELDAPALEAK